MVSAKRIEFFDFVTFDFATMYFVRVFNNGFS